MKPVLAILGMGAVTYVLRLSFLMLPERLQLPAAAQAALRYVPVALLTALWAPELLLQKGVLALTPDNARLLAGIVAIGVAWRTRMTLATIVAGLVSLHFFDWVF
jgi:branched-subunit amino acid transport protein